MMRCLGFSSDFSFPLSFLKNWNLPQPRINKFSPKVVGLVWHPSSRNWSRFIAWRAASAAPQLCCAWGGGDPALLPSLCSALPLLFHSTSTTYDLLLNGTHKSSRKKCFGELCARLGENLFAYCGAVVWMEASPARLGKMLKLLGWSQVNFPSKNNFKKYRIWC